MGVQYFWYRFQYNRFYIIFTPDLTSGHQNVCKALVLLALNPAEVSLAEAAFLSPEQIEGKNVGMAADLFALGTVLYETITGRKTLPTKG